MQTKTTTQNEYTRRINRLTEYINIHIEEDLDLNKLAQICNLSPYHFHRITKAFLGEPLGAYIGRLRVEKAARSLRYTNLSVQEIAFSVGYNSPSSLTKVFNQHYGISPTEFRNNKNFVIMKPAIINTELNLKAPKIKELEEKTALYIRQTGEYSSLDFESAYTRLWGCVKEQKLFSAGIEHICVYHDDPKVTDSDKLRTDICLAIRKPAIPNGEIGIKTINGGKYAIFLHQGSYDNLGSVYDTIFGHWLPESECTLRDAPCFEKYISNPKVTAPEKLKTEIYVPIV